MPVAPTLIQGSRDTQTLNTETRRSRDVNPALAMLEPDSGPLSTILTKLRKKGAIDPKVEWFEDQLLPRFDVLAADVAAVDATITVTNFKFFRAGDLIRINKSEVVRCTATPTTTVVTVKRGVGEVAAKTATSGQQLHIIGNSNAEGASVRSLLSTQRVPVFNYLQILRDPWGVSKTQKATASFAGQDWTEEAQKQLIEHKKHMELILMAGQRNEDTTGAPIRSTRGFEQFVSSNVTAINGALTETLLDNFMRTGFRYGSKSKLLICSPVVSMAINGFAKPKLRLMEKAKTYGITLTAYEMAGRTLLLHDSVLMTNNDLNDFSGLAGEAFLIDIEDLTLRYIAGRFAIHNENIQAPDADGRIDEYLSEFGLELHQEAMHGKLTGING